MSVMIVFKVKIIPQVKIYCYEVYSFILNESGWSVCAKTVYRSEERVSFRWRGVFILPICYQSS